MTDQLRAGQLLGPFGPGAMVDLPKAAVLIAGLDDWHYAGKYNEAEIEEPRLQAKLRNLLGVPSIRLYAPPSASDSAHDKDRPAVTAWQFPRWFVANAAERQTDGWLRRPLVHLDSIKHQEMKHVCARTGKRVEVSAVRFVRACRKGHLSDIDWPAFVHRNRDERCGRQLWLEERGTSGDLRDIWVICDCGAKQRMTIASSQDPGVLGNCNGEQPWLGDGARERCGERNRLLIRTASNAWFGQLMSALSIPAVNKPVESVVRDQWTTYLSGIESLEDLRRLRQLLEPLKIALEGFSDEEVFEAIVATRSSVDAAGAGQVSVKSQEYVALAAAQPAAVAQAPPTADFEARRLEPEAPWPTWMAPVEQVVLVHRLRQVTALVGFTRFEAAGPDTSGELDPEVARAPLSRGVRWLPATENRGEGIFVQFQAAAMEEWAQRPAVQARAKMHTLGHDAWRKAHNDARRHAPSLAYYALHSLSHLLMTAIALDCGYPSSALSERVYAEPGELGKPGRYGILILTSSSDSEGTLGGLVDAGRRIEHHLRRALEMGALCSNDPVCAQHEPGDAADQPLQGAACHGCVLVAETSCEQGNDFLDRALVVPIMGQPPETALFGRP